VVEHNVEHDLEPRIVQRADHGLELGHRIVDRVAASGANQASGL